ncbi:MAG: hypothetical protein EA398_14125 [Deltaproteobacteria bacterium]|nr:MAG: hypothetical protein EA398_14125 [Deltaproteobacteria bacterium]
MGEPPLSQCGLFIRYAEPWPDLPLTLFAAALGHGSTVSEMQPDPLLGDFFGSREDAVYRVEPANEADRGPWWLLAHRGCGLAWDGEAYPGWSQASPYVLARLPMLEKLVPERRIGEVLLRYIDVFEAERASLLHERLHWPAAQGVSVLPLMSGDVPFRLTDRTRGRIQYRIEKPVLEDEDGARGAHVHAIVTTAVFADLPNDQAIHPSAASELAPVLQNLHTWAKRLFWDLLKPAYREAVSEQLFSAEEREMFAHDGEKA